MTNGACVKDVDQQQFVTAFAEFLKNSGKVKVPAWTDQVKTATHKELSPYNPDWWVKNTFNKGTIFLKQFSLPK